MRHAALMLVENQLLVFWTQAGNAPEHIKLSVIDMTSGFEALRESRWIEVLRPELEWEGADKPVENSFRSSANARVYQLRDPAIFHDKGRTYLLYAVAGESGIGIAELFIKLEKP